MGWRKWEGDFAAWRAATSNAPYRASVGTDIVWNTMDPNPRDLSVAYLSSRRGHRLLLAFERLEDRDYFLACYSDQDAQSEPNGTDVASSRRPKQKKRQPASLDEAKLALAAARTAEIAALADVERGFNDEIEALLRQNEVHAALRLVKSMHPDCVMRSLAISRIHETGKWDRETEPFYKIEALPLNPKRASLMIAWLKSHQALKEARNAFEALDIAEVTRQGGIWRYWERSSLLGP